jgi:hypothetical protein
MKEEVVKDKSNEKVKGDKEERKTRATCNRKIC